LPSILTMVPEIWSPFFNLTCSASEPVAKHDKSKSTQPVNLTTINLLPDVPEPGVI
jgi:hypothetical protein